MSVATQTRGAPPVSPPAPVRPVLTPPARGRSLLAPVALLLVSMAVVAVRLPAIGGWLAKDESGYLVVGRQWRAGGTSLYGNYWVDRPPLLITIFKVAADFGGAVPLRLIGIGTVVVAVLAVAVAVWTLAGPGSAVAAAVAAAAFLVSPLTGAGEVNGELLSAPFVALGLAAVIRALCTSSEQRAAWLAALAGASGLAAVLVKQNMLDVLVFGGVMLLLGARRLGAIRSAVVVCGALTGGSVTLGAAALWTVWHGTSLPGVWFAMYRFRVLAGMVMALYPGGGLAGRQAALLLGAVLSGMVLAGASLLVTCVLAPHDYADGARVSAVARLVPVALLATVGYDALSIYLGGNFWLRYLVQAAVPLALAVGLAGGRRAWPAQALAAVLAVASAAGIYSQGLDPAGPGGNPVGVAIGAVARPADTIITIWGHPDVTRSSGLTSPYPYLWFLPERTLDPRLRLLTGTLSGPSAPTWFVTMSGTGLRGVDTTALRSVLHHRYRVVVHERDGVKVYLRDGVRRARPVTAAKT